MGEICLQFAGGGLLVLQGVRYMPDAWRNLISIPQLREQLPGDIDRGVIYIAERTASLD